MAAIARPLPQLSARSSGVAKPLQPLSSRSANSQASSRSGAISNLKVNAKPLKAGGKTAAIKKKKAAPKAAKGPKLDAENVPPPLQLRPEDLLKTDIYKNIPRLPSTRRVAFDINECRAMILRPLTSIAEGDDEEEGQPNGAPDYEALKAQRRERRAAQQRAASAPLPTGEDRPAGAVARNALLADSLAARMAARRKDKLQARTQAAKVSSILEGGSALHGRTEGLPSAAPHLSSGDLEKLQADREKRVQALLTQLDKLSAGELPAASKHATASTAIATYQKAPLLGGLQAATLVSLLHGEGARQMGPVARQWLAQEGSAGKVRALLEQAPPEYQGPLVAVLSRLLTTEEAMEDDVRITILGCNAMLNGGTKNNEERPLPRPLDALDAAPRHSAPPKIASPLEVWEADQDGSFTLRV